MNFKQSLLVGNHLLSRVLVVACVVAVAMPFAASAQEERKPIPITSWLDDQIAKNFTGKKNFRKSFERGEAESFVQTTSLPCYGVAIILDFTLMLTAPTTDGTTYAAGALGGVVTQAGDGSTKAVSSSTGKTVEEAVDPKVLQDAMGYEGSYDAKTGTGKITPGLNDAIDTLRNRVKESFYQFAEPVAGADVATKIADAYVDRIPERLFVLNILKNAS